VGITGEITIASLPPRPTVGVGSSVGVGSVSEEVVDFFKEFDKRTPNPHPEWHFWNSMGLWCPLGTFGSQVIACPICSELTTEHGNFITNFKLSAGLGGPMLSLLGSVSGCHE
jgi:hypothetical protein